MADIPVSLVKEFVKVTKDTDSDKTQTQYQGTVHVLDSGIHVMLDGSNTLTPVSNIVDAQNGDRVMVTIENHRATILGNYTYPPSQRDTIHAQNTANEALDIINEVREAVDNLEVEAREAGIAADLAQQTADKAVEDAAKAQTQADNALSDATSAASVASSAQATASEALEGATNAKNQADKALADAATADLKASAAQSLANQAISDAENAKNLADAAQDDVDSVKENVNELEQGIEYANVVAGNAQSAANTALENAAIANQAAIDAQTDADAANAAAIKAQTTADSAVDKADTAQNTADEAKSSASSAQESIKTIKDDVATSQSEIEALATSLDTVSNTMQADYARKTEVSETAAQLQSQITQNAAQIQSTVTKITEVDETVGQAAADAQAAAAEAQRLANAAQAQAEEATSDAAAAQTAANEAKAAADAAQGEADTAKSAAAAADEKAAQAAADLIIAQQNLANVTSRLDSTEEEIEAAQAAVEAAQSAADQASTDAYNAHKVAQDAQNAADTAIANAETAQTTADTAKNNATAAQTTANQAIQDAANAQTTANQAVAAAGQAQLTANQAVEAAGTAQTEAREAQAAADEADKKAAQAAADLKAAEENLINVTSRLDSTEEEIEAAKDAVATAQSKADQAYADAAAAQAAADEAQQDATTAQNTANQAIQDALNAQNKANEAASAAATAQSTATTAKNNAATAQSKADQAYADAATAQTAADAAQDKADQAATDLAEAEQNLANVTSRVNATEEEIEEAQAAVSAAQQAADAAQEDADAAQTTADKAKADAATAQQAADTAKSAADAAQDAADAAQEAADAAQGAADALAIRVTTAETKITQNADAIKLAATKTELATTLGGYYTKAQTDAAINVSAEDILSSVSTTYQTKSAMSSYPTTTSMNSAISQKASEITNTVSATYATKTALSAVETTANAAKTYTDNAANNYGYQYKYIITLNGDPNTYYPVIIHSGDQNVMREIMVKRSYSDTAPSEWNGHTTTKGISITLKIKCNFGGWGGANYSWQIIDLEEMYGHVFAGAQHVFSNMGFAIFLRGGGSTGAVYTLYSDQPLEPADRYGASSPAVYYEGEQFAATGSYTWNAPAGRSYTDDIAEEIEGKRFTYIANVNTAIEQKADSILSTVSSTYQTKSAMSSYSTTAQMNSAISQSATNITNTVSATYATKTAVSALTQTATDLTYRLDNFSVGGRNLIAGTSPDTIYSGAMASGGSYKDVWTGKTIDIPTETEYVVSFEAKADVAMNIRCYFYSPNTTTKSVSSTGQTSTSGDGSAYVSVTTEWKRYWVKWTQTAATAVKNVIVGRTTDSTNALYIRAVKLESGHVPSAWSPAPEDIDSDISTAAKTATNYLNFSNAGLVVGDMTASTLGKNILINSNSVDVRNGTDVFATFGETTTIGRSTARNVYIDSDSVDIRNASTVLASFDEDTIYLGKNKRSSVINLCNGLATLSANTIGNIAEWFTVTSDLIRLKSVDGISIYSDPGESNASLVLDTVDDSTITYSSAVIKSEVGDSISAKLQMYTATNTNPYIGLTLTDGSTYRQEIWMNTSNILLRAAEIWVTDGNLRMMTTSGGLSEVDTAITWYTKNGKDPFIGYCTDSSDGTFMVCSLIGTAYTSGLAIGGSSGNLLWKGAKVATVSDNVASATTASKLSNTSAIGNSYTPVYFTSGGVPSACSVRNNDSEIGALGWTGKTADAVLITANTIAYWNGAYAGTYSNLTYCVKGAFGDMATKTASDYALASHNHSAANITSGTLAVARGGTGITSNPSMLVNLGSTTAASVFAASPRPGITGTLGLANGGTGGTTAAAARDNLAVWGYDVVSTASSSGTYPGLMRPDGTTTGYVRTPQSGIIPYQNGGHGTVGTSSWPFNNGYFKNLYQNGTKVSVEGHAHAWTSGSVTNGSNTSEQSWTLAYNAALDLVFLRGYVIYTPTAAVTAGTAITIGTISTTSARPGSRIALNVYANSTAARRWMGVINTDGTVVVRSSGALESGTGYNVYVEAVYYKVI